MVSGPLEQGNNDPAFRLGAWGRKIGIALLVIAALVIAYLIFHNFLRVAATIVILAAMFTYLLQPAVEWLVRVSQLKRRHPARIAATLVVYLALAGLVYGFGAAATHTLISNVQDLRQTWVAAPYHVPQQVVRMQQWYLTHVPAEVQVRVAERVRQEVAGIDKHIPALSASLLGLARQAGQWIALLIELIFVPLVAFYFLTDAAKVREQVLFFVPKRHRDSVIRYGSELDRILRRYVHGQLVLCLIAWAVVTVAMLIMGIPGALLLGVIAGVSRAIPVVGPVIGGVPLLAAVLLTEQWAGAFWWVLIGFAALHFIESKFIMPRILGDHLGVHPVIVILSLLVGYEMLGLLGMFLAPPAIAMTRFVLAVRRGEGANTPEQPGLPGLETALSDASAK